MYYEAILVARKMKIAGQKVSVTITICINTFITGRTQRGTHKGLTPESCSSDQKNTSFGNQKCIPAICFRSGYVSSHF